MIRKLSSDELAARPEYVQFLRSLAVGEGGMGTTEGEGVGKQSLKGRIKLAASAARVQVKFLRSDAKTVVFKVVDRL